MAADSILPFNTVTINAAATTTATFVWGSGTVRATPVLVQNTAGDGTLSKACAAKDIEASWDMIGDQTALNLAINETHTQVNVLPKKYNWQTLEERPKVPEGVYLVHLIGGTIPSPTETPNLDRKLQRVLDLCRRHPYN